jgi:hypothetical protein
MSATIDERSNPPPIAPQTPRYCPGIIFHFISIIVLNGCGIAHRTPQPVRITVRSTKTVTEPCRAGPPGEVLRRGDQEVFLAQSKTPTTYMASIGAHDWRPLVSFLSLRAESPTSVRSR